MEPREYLFSLEKFGIKFGLGNIRTLVASLGNPQDAFKSVLIAGTNGKGSVSAMVDTALRAASLPVGRYTSPHLVRLEERFAIDGAPVDSGTLTEAIAQLQALVERLLARGSLDAPPTFFEATTALAFELFRRAGVGVAVLEVGLGGRLDATNIVQPIASAITSIDFDHEQYLGNTLAAIATEKAGVMRYGVPVVVGRVPPEAREALVAMAGGTGARLVAADAGVTADTTSNDGRTVLRLTTPLRDYGAVTLGLRGSHQVLNAIVAVRLLETIETALPLSPADIVSGLRDVRWPARLQMIEMPDGRRVLIDAAHNPAGARALASYLTREYPDRLPLVFGAMRDKAVAPMLDALVPAASAVVMTEPSTPRACRAEELAVVARSLAPTLSIDVEPDPMRALARAWAQRPIVCAAGSIFLAGNLLDALGTSAREI